MHELYRRIKVWNSRDDYIRGTDNYHYNYQRSPKDEADAEIGRRWRQAEMYGLKPEHRTMSEVEEQIAEIHRRVT